ncbi:MAG: VWA-like domain-containing protein [Treponema sp.]|jgi:predicted metal-dependent peptidase|nr:VWA-like domain-containing protein [Treponema sp.]
MKDVQMNFLSDSKRQVEDLALDILHLSQNTLMVQLRFLSPALYQLPFCRDPMTTFATDGQNLYYGFRHIAKSHQIEQELVTHTYLHAVLHCIFHHPFVGALIDSPCWDLACDIAVEAAIAQLDISCARCYRSGEQKHILSGLNIPHITAERVYHYYREQQLSPETLAALREPFLMDEHDLWYKLSKRPGDDSGKKPETNGEDSSGDGGASGGGQRPAQEGEEAPSLNGDPQEQDHPEQGGEKRMPQPADGELKQQWKEISARIQTDLETLSRKHGQKAGDLTIVLEESNRETIDYAAFLRRFSVLGEVMGINEDEFDYVFYTYGLRKYGNMPLVEPLEYQECKRIREFVIAIDTSASVKGELVQKFAARTYDILKETENFFTRLSIYIIQCDSKIQQVRHITSREDFDNYLRAIKPGAAVSGGGGTDFRPVFQYVDELRQQGELTELKGLIYFTDGDGEYPPRKPDYDTAFIFADDDGHETAVPVWAIKVRLSQWELEEM